MIPYGRQNISQADIDAVVAVLRSDFLTQGPVVPLFEQAVALRCGAIHAVAVNSATSALHLACRALGLGPGDNLWTVPNTFVASANCALYCGASVDFVDIDPLTYNMNVGALREKLEDAEREGCLPKIVIPVHFAGQSCEMRAIKDLADRYGFHIIEDASHAIGGKYLDQPIGNCRYSDITIFSFHPVKIITTGEGGMALTNNMELAEMMGLLRSHGITRDPAQMVGGNKGSWHYEQIELGYNYRMTDLQAALGVSQLARLDEFVEQRNALANRYDRLLAGSPLQLPKVAPGITSAFHLYVVRLRAEQIRRTHREVFDCLRELGIGVNVHYMPIHLQPYYLNLGFGPGLCVEAERYGQDAISLPLYPGLTEGQQDRVVLALSKALA